MNNFKIVEFKNGQVTYETKNEEGQKIFYCLIEHPPKNIEMMRCSQPLKEGFDIYYEPSHPVMGLNGGIHIELPKGESRLEVAVMRYIELHPMMEGF